MDRCRQPFTRAGQCCVVAEAMVLAFPFSGKPCNVEERSCELVSVSGPAKPGPSRVTRKLCVLTPGNSPINCKQSCCSVRLHDGADGSRWSDIRRRTIRPVQLCSHSERQPGR